MSPRGAPAAFALCAALGLGRELWVHLVVERGAQWTPVDLRYAPLKAALPKVPEAGYVSDEPCDTQPGDDVGHGPGRALYQTAQYALAPTVLHYEDVHAPVIVANLRDPANLDRVARERGLRVVRDLGNGLALLAP